MRTKARPATVGGPFSFAIIPIARYVPQRGRDFPSLGNGSPAIAVPERFARADWRSLTAINEQALLAARDNAMQDLGGTVQEGIAAFVIFLILLFIYWECLSAAKRTTGQTIG